MFLRSGNLVNATRGASTFSDSPGARRLHALAVLTAAATFPLIFMGGLVTSHHAGLSVPDWPNSYHYNMFLFPPSQWVGGILYEHTHRLMGSVVGFLSVVLTLWAWGVARESGRRRRIIQATWAAGALTLIFAALAGILGGRLGPRARQIIVQGAVGVGGVALVLLFASFARTKEPRRWVRWLAAGTLGMVIFQGLLGGLRVVLVNLDLAIVHACTAQAFFCLAALVAVVTSPWWKQAPNLSAAPGGGRLVGIAIVTVLVVYGQLVIGATMRHFDAGLAIPDFPLAYGKLLPPASAADLAAANHLRAFRLNLDPVTMAQVWLHFAHRLGALLVSGFVIALSVLALRQARPGPNRSANPHGGLRTPAALLLVLLAAQITLGALTVLLRKPADVASLHVAVGALVLVTSFVLAVRAVRLYGRRSSRTVPLDVEPARKPACVMQTV